MKKILILVVGSLFFTLNLFGQERDWQNVTPALLDIKDILISCKNYRDIYIATSQGVFKSKDKINQWQLVLKLKEVVFLFEDKYGFLYAGNKDELYFSDNQGMIWRRLYRSNKGESLTDFTVVDNYCLYLGTDRGIVFSEDKGKTWQKLSLEKFYTLKIVYAPLHKFLYILTEKGLYRLDPNKRFLECIFIQKKYSNQDIDSNLTEEDSELQPNYTYKVKDIEVDNQGNLYLATQGGVLVSYDRGNSWNLLADSGLLRKDIDLIYIKDSKLYAINSSGVFLYKIDRWVEISLRLPVVKINALAEDEMGNLYIATNKGLFKSLNSNYSNHKDLDDLFKDEPDILEVQKKALSYAGVVEPAQIEKHRILARIKAILPTLKFDYDKTITYYSNTNSTRFAVGPYDWGVSLSWNLSDLIWSEQQRLIDSQARLLIELRNDLLDEVNKLYFERLRIKQELLSGNLEPNKYKEKIIKLKELTASLDALTGGCFSQLIREKQKF
jgi:hypothetical protein